MELIIVRHARPEHVVDAAGSADPDLTEVGRRQAELVGAHLLTADIDRIVSSPLARARQTAAPLAGRLGLEPVIVEGVAEFDRGDSSYVPAEIARESRDDTWKNPLSVLGDAARDQWIAAVVEAFRSIITDNAGRTVVVFCHGMVTSVWFAHLLGIDDMIRFVPDYCGVTRMLASSSTDSVTVRSFNETHFLADTHIPLF